MSQKRLFGYFVAVLFGIWIGSVPIALVGLVILGCCALLPNKNPFLYWPVGLMAVILTTYCGYIAIWLSSGYGVDLTKSRYLLVSVAVFFLLTAHFHHWKHSNESEIKELDSTRIKIMLCLPAFLIIAAATIRLYESPVSLISGFMAGGDHNMHVELTHRLMSWSGWKITSAPLTFNGYPKGIHFLIANLTAMGSSASSHNQLSQQFLVSAWFEWVQLAAVLQSGLLVISTGVRRFQFWHLFAIFILSVPIILTNNLVAHLFWSGFTTTLGITWVLMLSIAFPWTSIYKGSQILRQRYETLFFLILFFVASLIIYQPYALVYLAVVCGYLVYKSSSNARFLSGLASQVRYFKIQYFPFLIFIFLLLIVGTAKFTIGNRFGLIDQLLTDGRLAGTDFNLVISCLVLALVAVAISSFSKIDKERDVRDEIPSGILLGVNSMAIAVSILVVTVSPFGFKNQPYYSQKLFWITITLSLPFVLSRLLNLFNLDFIERRKRLKGFGFIFLCLLPITTYFYYDLNFRNPSRHGSVDWAARGILESIDIARPRSIAVSPGDVLGTHLANLAIRTRTEVNLPIEMALSGDIRAICTYANREEVLLIYTGSEEATKLRAAGCDPNISYIENGMLETDF